MNLKGRYYCTVLLVVIAIIGSIASFFIISHTGKDAYPFFYWKLYAQPSGTNHRFTEYRIYSKDQGQHTFQRNSIQKIKGFSDDEYYYTLHGLVTNTLADSMQQTGAKRKLRKFIRHVLPSANEVKIVSETYNPVQLIHSPMKYDTATVITF